MKNTLSKKNQCILLISCITILFHANNIFARPGDLDTGFGTGGVVISNLFATYDSSGASAIAVQADGKIVVSGSASNGSNSDIALVRYSTGGSPDTGFGNQGKIITDFNNSTDYASAIAIQADGKIVVSGSAFNGSNYDIVLVRYSTDGSPDTGFGNQGKIITDFNNSFDHATDIAIQVDGKIVVAGYTKDGINGDNGSNYDFALVRYNTDGSPDTGFGNQGKIFTDFNNSFDIALAIAIQADGKIVVSGRSTSNGSKYDFALVRYNTDGSSDTGFGNQGKILTDFNNGNDIASAIAIQADGKIVVFGSAYNGSNYDFALVRYNTDGSPDTGFGNQGKIITDFINTNDYASAMAIQADRKIVVAGKHSDGFVLEEEYGFSLARYLADQTLTYTASNNGSISGPTPQTVVYGNSGTAVTAVPDSGYHFVCWSDGSTANPRTDSNITADITVTAIFAKDSDQTPSGGGSCFINDVSPGEAEPSEPIGYKKLSFQIRVF